jgi:ubiquinone/menaquinone biosynthesis C-methylase UbiE
MYRPPLNERERREAAHFDAEAAALADLNLRDKPVAASLTPMMARVAALLGDARGLRILDVGCGDGQWTLRFAQAGANVEGIDISTGMLAIAQKRLAKYDFGARVHLREMSAMRLDYPDATFDVVHGRYIVHHLDPAEFGAEVARVLKPGGVAIFCENNGTNSILMLARNTLCGRFGISKWSTDDEYPLTPTRRQQFARNFSSLQAEYPEFIMFDLFDAKFFRRKVRAVTRFCTLLDKTCGSISWLRRYSYFQLIMATR